MNYIELLAQARADLDEANYAAIRQAYTELPTYEPYSLPVDMQDVHAAMEQGDWAVAGHLCAELLEHDFLQIDLHLLMGYLYQQTNTFEAANWHFSFANGLTRAILSTGDGTRVETAFKIIHIREEYDILRFFELEPVEQALVAVDERRYDEQTVQKNGEQLIVYFDVEAMMSHLDKKVAE